jgi:transcription termination/antitermination protein NusG
MNLHPSWFALTVKPRHEKVVAQHLRLRGLEEFLPLQRVRRSWSDRTQAVDLPLFPGYVFCRFSYRERLHALNTPSVRSIVGFANADIPLDDTEIASIQSVMVSGLAVTPWPYLRVGEQVTIEQGALEGVRGTILREKGPWRLIVNVELLQRSVAVEIDRELVGPLRPSISPAA